MLKILYIQGNKYYQIMATLLIILKIYKLHLIILKVSKHPFIFIFSSLSTRNIKSITKIKIL